MEEVIHPVEEVIHTLVIIVSAQSKELGFGFFRLGLTLGSEFGACWDRGSGTIMSLKRK